MEKLTPAQLELIKKPLPPEAVKPHPTKTYLSSIKAIYVTERLNEVFWVGVWQIRVRKEEAGENGMIVIHTIFEVPSYWIYYECFGGNDNWGETSKNFDLWDAYKWATTDAITKIASWIGIWIDVFKGKWNTPQKSVSKKEIVTDIETVKPLDFDEYLVLIKQEDNVDTLRVFYKQAFESWQFSESQMEILEAECKKRADRIQNPSKYNTLPTI